MKERGGAFEYAGLRIQVASTDAGALVWLDEFLHPWMDLGNGRAAEEPCHARVALDVDPEEFAALRRRHGGSGDQVDCFVLDNETVRHPTWRAPDGGQTVFDGELGVFYQVSRGATETHIVAADARGPARIALMRVVRELAMSHARRGDRLLLHGAALAINGRALVIAGPKGGGKTTLLLHALQASGAEFVANDRVLLDLGPPDAIARGLPSIVSIRPPTLALFPALSSRLSARGYRHSLTLAEAREGRHRATARPWASVTPAQLCSAVGVAPLAAARAEAMVFPLHDPAVPGARVGRPTRRRARALLAGALFGLAPHVESAVFSPAVTPGATSGGAGRSPRHSLDALCERVMARVPTVECRLGVSAYGGPVEAEALVREVLQLIDAPWWPAAGA